MTAKGRFSQRQHLLFLLAPKRVVMNKSVIASALFLFVALPALAQSTDSRVETHSIISSILGLENLIKCISPQDMMKATNATRLYIFFRLHELEVLMYTCNR